MKSFKIYSVCFAVLLLLALLTIGASLGFSEMLTFFKTHMVALLGVIGAVAIASINPHYVYHENWTRFTLVVVVQLLLCGLLFLADKDGNSGAWIATGSFVLFLLISTPITLFLRKKFGGVDY